MNYYGTEEYYRKLKHLETDVYTQENLKTPIEVTDLTDEYRLEHCYYADEKHKKPGWSAEDGSVNRLYKNGVKIFEWKTLDAETLTKKIFRHSNGRDYMIFNEGLYGYSVLELDTLECMHYIPAQSHRDGDGFEETFIWCEAFYNPYNDYAVVEGCYWAAPFQFIVVDLRDPLKIIPTDEWKEDVDLLDQESLTYVKGFDFEKWENDVLVCTSAAIDSVMEKRISDRLTLRIQPKAIDQSK